MDIRFRDIIDPERWRAVIVFLLKRCLRALGPDDTPYLERHEVEQLALRFLDKDCSICLDKGSCTHCGCHTEGRMNGWGDSCSAGNWGPVVDKEIWNKRKRDLNIKFSITYNNKK